LKTDTNFPTDFCSSSSSDYLSKVLIDVDPYPIHLVHGENITTVINIDLIKSITTGSKLKLKLKRLGFIDIEIPCIKVCKKRIRGHS